VDGVLLESVDERIHLQPLVGTLAEAIAIAELARQSKVPFFSSSSSRFGAELVALNGNADVGDVLGAATWGPCSYQSGTPVFLRHPRHRGAFHAYGYRMRDRLAHQRREQ